MELLVLILLTALISAQPIAVECPECATKANTADAKSKLFESSSVIFTVAIVGGVIATVIITLIFVRCCKKKSQPVAAVKK